MNKSLLSLAILFSLFSFAIVLSGDFPLFKHAANNKGKNIPVQTATKRRLCKNLSYKNTELAQQTTKVK